MEMNYCRRCGSKLSQISTGTYICDNQHKLYVNGIATVSVFFVTDDNQVLLSIRGIEPHKGKLDSIGGFVDAGENLEQALAREISEEIGLAKHQYDNPQYFCSASYEYPYGGECVGVANAFFVSRLRPGAQPVPNDDVAEVVHIPISDIDFTQIGNEDVKFALGKLKETLI